MYRESASIKLCRVKQVRRFADVLWCGHRVKFETLELEVHVFSKLYFSLFLFVVYTKFQQPSVTTQ
jgi:hypothetical protein